MESHWYFTGFCYFGNCVQNDCGCTSSQMFWLQQQDFTSCKCFYWLLDALFSWSSLNMKAKVFKCYRCVKEYVAWLIGWNVSGSNWGVCICSSEPCFQLSSGWGTSFGWPPPVCLWAQTKVLKNVCNIVAIIPKQYQGGIFYVRLVHILLKWTLDAWLNLVMVAG